MPSSHRKKGRAALGLHFSDLRSSSLCLPTGWRLWVWNEKKQKIVQKEAGGQLQNLYFPGMLDRCCLFGLHYIRCFDEFLISFLINCMSQSESSNTSPDGRNIWNMKCAWSSENSCSFDFYINRVHYQECERIRQIEDYLIILCCFLSDPSFPCEINFVPGLYKIFDEILVNACDNFQRDPDHMSYIKAGAPCFIFSDLQIPWQQTTAGCIR